ncbi:hypothetical protein [Methylobacterium sp. 37f]|uniref:hypothetical protein n=1 Tax=Methylobacterium sp. 37f TaxID=2817058 RepID=UPI001FFCFA3E|nr:hypothetical protein [Methylobacterium sp. 37f]MCK2057223.1 hypothetical protein [Methylobacterium sp. 37f]
MSIYSHPPNRPLIRPQDFQRDERYPEELDYLYMSEKHYNAYGQNMFDDMFYERNGIVQPNILKDGNHRASFEHGLTRGVLDGGDQFRDVYNALVCEDLVSIFAWDRTLTDVEIVERLSLRIARVERRDWIPRDLWTPFVWHDAGNHLHHGLRLGQIEAVAPEEGQPRKWRITRHVALYTIEGGDGYSRGTGRAMRSVDCTPDEMAALRAAWLEGDRARRRRQRRNLLRRLDRQTRGYIVGLSGIQPDACVSEKIRDIGDLPHVFVGAPLLDVVDVISTWHRQNGHDEDWSFDRLQDWQGAPGSASSPGAPRATLSIPDADAESLAELADF